MNTANLLTKAIELAISNSIIMHGMINGNSKSVGIVGPREVSTYLQRRFDSYCKGEYNVFHSLQKCNGFIHFDYLLIVEFFGDTFLFTCTSGEFRKERNKNK